MDKEIKQILEKEEEVRQIKAAAEAKAKETIHQAQKRAAEMESEQAKLLLQQEKEAITRMEADLENKKNAYQKRVKDEIDRVKEVFRGQKKQIVEAVFKKILGV
ncbi:MAG: hypothetical protein J7J25_03485 [Candidatus Omnitrophica bacterium]|nr:hypothetical protein [Candidatus Omnitrophota bacterium]